MPNTPVISIDVDDSQFKAFYALFSQYTEKLGTTNQRWKDASAKMQEAFGGSTAQGAADLAPALDRSTRSAIALNRVTMGLGRAFGAVGKTVGVIVDGLRMARHYALRLSEVLTGAVVGFDRLAASGVGRVNAARAVNSTSGRVSAFRAAANATGLAPADMPASIIQGITQRPGLTMLAGQAIGMTNQQMMQHTVTASLRLIQQARTWMRAHRNENPAVIEREPMVQAMEAMGLSFSNLVQLGNTPQRDINQMTQFVGQNARQFELQRGTALQMARFRMDIAAAGLTIETDLINRLRQLGPSLGETIKTLADRFVDLINTALTPQNIAAVKHGLETVGAFLDSPRFRQDLQGFADAVGGVARWVLGVLKSVGGTPMHGRHNATGLMGGMTPRQNFAANIGMWNQQAAVRSEFGGGRVGGMLSTLGTSDQAFSRHVLALPSVRAKLAAFERANGLPPGTLLADAAAESAGNLFAQNGDALGAFQLMPASRRRYGVANAFDPLQAGRGEAAQLSQNLATARLLMPTGTLLQHLEMAKAANILGDQGFIRFWQQEKARHRLPAWMRDMAPDNRSDIHRFVASFPNNFQTELAAGNQLGQIDAGVSTAAQIRIAQADLANASRRNRGDQGMAATTTNQHLASIDRKLSTGLPVNVTVYTPVTARTANQLNGMQ